MKNIFRLLLFGLLLLPPFILRHLNGHLEVYPAVLLPAGASLVQVDSGLLETRRIDLYGLDVGTGKPKQLDSKLLLAPIPHRYLPGIVEHGFGLDSVVEESLKIPYLDLQFKKRRRFTNASITAAKNWLRDKLKAQQCMDSMLIIRVELRRFDVALGQWASSELIYEDRYLLH